MERTRDGKVGARSPAEFLTEHVGMLIKVTEASQACIESERESKH
jgi:hypothetical protein